MENRQNLETELRQLDVVPQQIFVLGTDQDLLYANPVSLEYCGRSLQEIQGKKALARIVHRADFVRVVSEARRGFSSSAPFAVEARLRRHDGRYLWFLVRLNPLCDQAGRVVRWYGTRTDIHERKQAEAGHRVLIDIIPAMVATCRPDGSADYLNEYWQKYYGLSLDELRDWRWKKVIHPEDEAGLMNEWMSAVATGDPLDTEVRVRRADGEYRWLMLHTVPERDELGNIIKWYAAGHDISDHKRAEEDLRRNKDRLAAAQNPEDTNHETHHGELSPRQTHVLTLIADGYSTKQIALKLDISIKTVESHRGHLKERLNIHDIAGLVRYAIKQGLVNLNQ